MCEQNSEKDLMGQEEEESALSTEQGGQDRGELNGIWRELGDLPAGAIVTEEALAQMFDRHHVSIKRAVQRGELPPPTRLLGNPVWTAGRILEHIERRLEAAKKEADRLSRKISDLST